MKELIGLPLKKAEEILKSRGEAFEVSHYNDKKMKTYDKTLVLQAKRADGKIKIVACNFLFSVGEEK